MAKEDLEVALPACFSRSITLRMVEWGRSNDKAFGLLARLAFSAGLRVPSEALKARSWDFGVVKDSSPLSAWMDFPSGRKHKRFAHRLERFCICSEGRLDPLCFPHLVISMGHMFPGVNRDESALPGVSTRDQSPFIFVHSTLPLGSLLPVPDDQVFYKLYSRVLKTLKSLGKRWSFPNWAKWGSHGWRRGLAALRASKAQNLEEILDAGDWAKKSRAYLKYIASMFGLLEARAAALAMQDSDDE